MTNPPNTTPLNEELDKLFEPLIDNPSLTLTSTYWNEAKQELTKLIQTLEKKARIDEAEHYDTNLRKMTDATENVLKFSRYRVEDLKNVLHTN